MPELTKEQERAALELAHRTVYAESGPWVFRKPDPWVFDICRALISLHGRVEEADKTAKINSAEMGNLRADLTEARALSNKNHDAALGFQDRALRAERREESQSELARVYFTELTEARRQLEIAVKAIEQAPHGWCQIEDAPRCIHCGKRKERHMDAAYPPFCPDGRGRPETTKWEERPARPCNCWKSQALAQIAEPQPTQATSDTP